MEDVHLPPCGLYRTLRAVGAIPSGRLVYFHNHGDPGPGLYLPSSWIGNRARFEERGVTLPSPADVAALEPLAREGFYRVVEPFHCCERKCVLFEAEALVQLGYDAQATPIVFVPEIVDGMLGLPERGTRIDREQVRKMHLLHVRVADGDRSVTH